MVLEHACVIPNSSEQFSQLDGGIEPTTLAIALTLMCDITKPAEKMTPPPPDSLANDDLMKKMDIRVANLIYYYKNKNKLIRDIQKVGLNQIKSNLKKYQFLFDSTPPL